MSEKPPLETLHMLRELAGYTVGRQPMTPTSRERLETVLADQRNQIKLHLSALAAHKISCTAELLSAIDLCRTRMVDPDYIKKLYEEPAELRRHLQTLTEIHSSDVEFLTNISGEKADQKGYSDDPVKELNIFFGSMSPDLPSDLTVDERRKVQQAMMQLTSIIGRGGSVAQPPNVSHRVVDVEVEAVEEEAPVDEEDIGPTVQS